MAAWEGHGDLAKRLIAWITVVLIWLALPLVRVAEVHATGPYRLCWVHGF